MSTIAPKPTGALVRREHPEPHAILGAHPDNGGVVIRAFCARRREIGRRSSPPGKSVLDDEIHPGGVFEGRARGREAAAAATSSRSTTARAASSRSTIRTRSARRSASSTCT